MAVSICAAEGIDAAGELGRASSGSAASDAATGRAAWLTDGRAEKIRQLIAAGLNCPLTSSAGRLFDAAAALLDLCDTAGYEAQGAIRLETAAVRGVGTAYPFAVDDEELLAVLDLGPAFRAQLDDAGRSTGCHLGEVRQVIAAPQTGTRRGGQRCGTVRRRLSEQDRSAARGSSLTV
jgi:hypothetical protein